jgi:hypothetical protein
MNKQKQYVPPGVERRRIITEGVFAASYTRSVSNNLQYEEDEQPELSAPDLIIN